MGVFCNFEITAETLFPPAILPSGPQNPYLVQGFFVQVSSPPSATVTNLNFDLMFQETTDFTQGSGQGSLSAQIIGADGVPVAYTDFFTGEPGFKDNNIDAGQTLIFGVQCLASLNANAQQNGTGWRGTMSITGAPSGALIFNPTHRLVYFDGTDLATAKVINSNVYPVQTVSGSSVEH